MHSFEKVHALYFLRKYADPTGLINTSCINSFTKGDLFHSPSMLEIVSQMNDRNTEDQSLANIAIIATLSEIVKALK